MKTFISRFRVDSGVSLNLQLARYLPNRILYFVNIYPLIRSKKMLCSAGKCLATIHQGRECENSVKNWHILSLLFNYYEN